MKASVLGIFVYVILICSATVYAELNIDVSTIISTDRRYIEFYIENNENYPVECSWIKLKVSYKNRLTNETFGRRVVSLKNIRIAPRDFLHEQEGGKSIIDAFMAQDHDAVISDYIWENPKISCYKANFLNYCLDEYASAEVKHTVSVLKRKVNKSDCRQAAEALSDRAKLNLSGENIVDIRPLGSLPKLANRMSLLDLSNNRIEDLTPLAQIQEIRSLYLQQNRIKDIYPLSNLKVVKNLDLSSNMIVDISPLSSLSYYLNDYIIWTVADVSAYECEFGVGGPGSYCGEVFYELNLKDNLINNFSPLIKALTNINEETFFDEVEVESFLITVLLEENPAELETLLDSIDPEYCHIPSY